MENRTFPHNWIPGLELAETFFHEVVEPLLTTRFPGLAYTACLMGSGTEVLGFDTPVSADHHWGPRVMVFIRPENRGLKEEISEFLALELPPTFRGWSTNWGPPDAIGVRLLEPVSPGNRISHRVEISTMSDYFQEYLGVDPSQRLSPSDWLITSEQKLLSVIRGRVFRDELGLQEVRDRLSYYPDDIWMERMAVNWDLIGQEEPFIGRCADVGDDLGSRLVAARLVQTATQLAFQQEKQFAPYSKWLGTAFRGLAGASALGITPSLPTTATLFYDRPYRVIHGERFAAALRDALVNPPSRSTHSSP